MLVNAISFTGGGAAKVNEYANNAKKVIKRVIEVNPDESGIIKNEDFFRDGIGSSPVKQWRVDHFLNQVI